MVSIAGIKQSVNSQSNQVLREINLDLGQRVYKKTGYSGATEFLQDV